MFIEMTVFDARNAKRGRVQLELDFTPGSGPKTWSLQEVLEGDGWGKVSFSNPSQGTFEVKDWGVVWFWEQDPKSGGRRNTLILHDAPKALGDAWKESGGGRVYDPNDVAFKDGRVEWRVQALTTVRRRVLDIIARVFPAYPGCLPIPNVIDKSASYSGGVTNCGTLPGWIARQLGYYLPWEEKYKNWKFRKQEYVYKLPADEVYKVKRNAREEIDAATAPMAAEWGDLLGPRLQSYPEKVEAARGLAPGTIWVPYNGGRENKGRRPKPGDIYVLMSDFAGNFAHVGIIVDSAGREWRTADCGQCGLNAAAYKRRMFDEAAGTLILNPPESKGPDAGTRWLHGWIDIDQLFSSWKG